MSGEGRLCNVEMLFRRLLVLGHQCNLDVTDVLQFDMSPVPPALLSEYGGLRNSGKCVLIKCLGAPAMTPHDRAVLVDAGQLLYHAVWPVAGTAKDLASSFGVRLASYPPVSNK